MTDTFLLLNSFHFNILVSLAFYTRPHVQVTEVSFFFFSIVRPLIKEWQDFIPL